MTRIMLAGLALLSLAACTVTTPSLTVGTPPPAPAPAPVIVQQPAAPSVIVR